MDALRKAGATVHDTHNIGRGYPDISVGYRGINLLIEIKVPGAKLNNVEHAWFEKWRGQAAVVYSAEEALVILETINGLD